MADENDNASPPPPKPASPPPMKKAEPTPVAAPAPAQTSAAPIRPAPKRMGFDPLRPFRYGWSFVRGTVSGLLDGMATTGRKGMWAGIAVGILLTIGGGLALAPMFILGGAVTGLVGGAVLGGTFGGLTGGLRDLGVSRRRDKYAHEVAEHQAARATRPTEGPAPVRASNYRDAAEIRRRINTYNFDRTLQQDEETDRYWQDREEARAASGYHQGRG